MDVAKRLGLDDTFIYMDKEEGWKLSRYIENARTLDYHNEQEVDTALSMMRKLHQENIKSQFRFGTWERSLEFVEKIRHKGRADFADFQNLLDMMEALYKLTKSDGIDERLCHCDCYDPNFLIGEAGKMYLAAGKRVGIVPGDRMNFKITTEFDLVLAECLLRAGAAD